MNTFKSCFQIEVCVAYKMYLNKNDLIRIDLISSQFEIIATVYENTLSNDVNIPIKIEINVMK